MLVHLTCVIISAFILFLEIVRFYTILLRVCALANLARVQCVRVFLRTH